ncbi:DUF3854 domain-containing protein [Trichocoleus sp. DQ-A3]|uniref:plasmid replication protein, CyRepA1 family n=1 Tax=Cyanophyceae TaxID=3028117 RepID=UPI00168599E0|nr:plasmid replication protein, CyRepA1 family [Coleofasciculus sp. FACHB-125]MBD1903780.1 DUF3854 domain-containing protein [Coleofasciculus sp. FACHB-125]
MLNPRHRKELQASGIHDDLIELNVRSLKGYQPHEQLLYSPKIERTNTGRVPLWMLRRYEHIEKGGWWCSGLDPLDDWKPMDWGGFKPDFPKRLDDGRLIKYEHPPLLPTRAFFPRISFRLAHKIARRYGLEDEFWERVSQLPTVQKGFKSLKIVESDRPSKFPKLKTQVLGKQLKRREDTGFWKWVLDNKIPVCVTEGAKKTASLLSAGFAAVALPGINGGYRQPKDEFGTPVGSRKLIPELEIFKDHPIYIVFDKDQNRKTIRAVNNATTQMGLLLRKQGCPVHVITWDEPQKGVDDFLVAHGVAAFEKYYDSALLLEEWQVRSYTQLTYPVNVALNQQYVGKPYIPPNAKLLGIKAPKGGGKTEFIAQMVHDAMMQGKWVLVLTHRVQLGMELCRRLCLPYVTEVSDCPTGKLLGFGLCVDSLHQKSQAKFSAETWRNGVVIIDECEQVIWHLLNSSTCQRNRVPILKEFKTLITNALTSETGQVILSDADLSDVSIDYVRELAGVNVDPWIVENTFKPEGWNVFHYADKTAASLVEALKNDISEGGRPFVYCTAQKVKSAFGTRILEAMLNQEFPDKKVLRIDSETISDPNHPAFGCTTRLNEILLNYDIVLCSPSLETGVSIDIRNHFTSVWGIFQGVVPESSARQALARVREPVDRHIWVVPYGLGKIGNGSISINSLLASENKLAKSNIAILKNADFQDVDVDTNFDPVSLRTWAKMAARVNSGMLSYRESILDNLTTEGHRVSTVDCSDGFDTWEMLDNLREVEWFKETKEIADSSEITQEQYQELKEKRSKTKSERYEERKHSLSLRYGIPVSPDLVTKDDEGWHPHIQMHYYLTLGREHLLPRDKKRLDAIKQQGEGAAWIPDLNKSLICSRIATLENLGVPNLLDRERRFKAGDDDLQAMSEKAKANKWQIKKALGISIGEEESPISIVQKLLDTLGLKLEYLCKEGERGQQKRVYGFVDPKDGREEVFAAWLARDKAAAETLAREQAEREQAAQEQAAREQAELQNVSSCDTVVTSGNKEYLNTDGDYQTSPQSINEGSEGSAAVRGAGETKVETAVRVLKWVNTPGLVTAVFEKLKRFPQEMKREIWTSIPDARQKELRKMEKDGRRKMEEDRRRLAEIPVHLQPAITEIQQKLLAATETETLEMYKIDYLSNFYEDWYYSVEEIRQIKDGIWLGLSEEERGQIRKKKESAEARLLAESKSFRAANHAPEPSFIPGQRVEFEGKAYVVTESTHSHSQLQGLHGAVANWELKLLEQEADLMANAFV